VIAPPVSATGRACAGLDVIETTLGELAFVRLTHSGLSVETTNSTATATVTACEKKSQVLRMKVRAGARKKEPIRKGNQSARSMDTAQSPVLELSANRAHDAPRPAI
jgi:hypothetical protein